MGDVTAGTTVAFLEILRSTPGALREILRTRDKTVLEARPFAGKWTPCEILGHLVDHEIVTACRIRTTRLTGLAWLGSYPQEEWVAIQQHGRGEPAMFVDRFEYVRRLNLEQYDALAEEEWRRRVPRTDGEGTCSLVELVQRHANHDLQHLDQLRRYVEAAAG